MYILYNKQLYTFPYMHSNKSECKPVSDCKVPHAPSQYIHLLSVP